MVRHDPSLSSCAASGCNPINGSPSPVSCIGAPCATKEGVVTVASSCSTPSGATVNRHREATRAPDEWADVARALAIESEAPRTHLNARSLEMTQQLEQQVSTLQRRGEKEQDVMREGRKNCLRDEEGHSLIPTLLVLLALHHPRDPPHAEPLLCL